MWEINKIRTGKAINRQHTVQPQRELGTPQNVCMCIHRHIRARMTMHVYSPTHACTHTHHVNTAMHGPVHVHTCVGILRVHHVPRRLEISIVHNMQMCG